MIEYVTRPLAARARYEADGWTVVLETRIRPETARAPRGASGRGAVPTIDAVVLARRVDDAEAA